MAGGFVVFDLMALREYSSDSKPSARKRKKENEKKEEMTRYIEDIGDQDTPYKQTIAVPRMLQA